MSDSPALELECYDRIGNLSVDDGSSEPGLTMTVYDTLQLGSGSVKRLCSFVAVEQLPG